MVYGNCTKRCLYIAHNRFLYAINEHQDWLENWDARTTYLLQIEAYKVDKTKITQNLRNDGLASVDLGAKERCVRLHNFLTINFIGPLSKQKVG